MMHISYLLCGKWCGITLLNIDGPLLRLIQLLFAVLLNKSEKHTILRLPTAKQGYIIYT